MKFVEERFKSKHNCSYFYMCCNGYLVLFASRNLTLAILAAFFMCVRRAGQAAPLAKKPMTRTCSVL